MKRYKAIILTAIMLFILTACGNARTGNPIILPDSEDIISIGIYDGTVSAVSIDESFIGEFLKILMNMEITDKQSVNDAPKNKDYITISLNCDDRVSTIFYYKDKDAEYVEQPYQGIYEPAPALGVKIKELFDSVDGTLATVTFRATVMEVSDAEILVEPVNGTIELSSADRIYVPNKEGLELQAGDIVEIEYDGSILESYPAQLGEVYNIKIVEQVGTDNKWDRIPTVMINGKLYYDTGAESTLDGRCGNMDGEITSTVDGSEIPTENNQSNFGAGFGYQYGADDTIEIYMNEKWMIFEHRSGEVPE